MKQCQNEIDIEDHSLQHHLSLKSRNKNKMHILTPGARGNKLHSSQGSQHSQAQSQSNPYATEK